MPQKLTRRQSILFVVGAVFLAVAVAIPIAIYGGGRKYPVRIVRLYVVIHRAPGTYTTGHLCTGDGPDKDINRDTIAGLYDEHGQETDSLQLGDATATSTSMCLFHSAYGRVRITRPSFTIQLGNRPRVTTTQRQLLAANDKITIDLN